MTRELSGYLRENLLPKLEKALLERVYSPPEQWLSLLENSKAEGWLSCHRKVILKNFREAVNRKLPMCQDTGAFNFLVSLSPGFIQKWVPSSGGWSGIRTSFLEVISSVVKSVSKKAYLRPSIFSDPLSPSNTGDNTPPFVEFELADVNKVRFFMKGGGSENGTFLETLSPSRGFEGIKEMLRRWAETKAVGVCPPLYVSMVVGGTSAEALFLSKRMLFELPKRFGYPDMEEEGDVVKELFDSVLGEGYVVAFSAKKLPRHIASLPVAISVSCNAWRVGEVSF